MNPETKRVLNYLKELDPQARCRMIRMMEGSESPELGRLVAELIHDPSPRVRYEAARLAGLRRLKIGSELLELLSDDYPHVRAVAVWAIGRIGDSIVQKAVMRALSDVDERVREVAVKTAAFSLFPGALDIIRRTMNTDPSERVRQTASRALSHLEQRTQSRTL